MKTTVLLLTLASLAFAQEPAKPSPAAPPPKHTLTDAASSRVIIAYQRAMLKAQEADRAQQAFNAARDAYFQACAKAAKEAGAPDGTTCAVDDAATTVTLTEPPAPAAKK